MIADHTLTNTAPSVASPGCETAAHHHAHGQLVHAEPRPVDPAHGPKGCYLVYEGTSGGRLMLHYSMGFVPENAVGFWLPSPDCPIQGFKFKQAGGRSELIKGIAGGDANRRKYFVGWCQFLKLCRARHGRAIMFTPAQGVPVDIYGYQVATQRPEYLDLQSGLIDITTYDAFAIVPRHAAFLRGVKSIVMANFLELGNLAGASTTVA